MLLTKAAKLERRFRSGDFRPFGHTKTSHIFHVVLSPSSTILAFMKADISYQAQNEKGCMRIGCKKWKQQMYIPFQHSLTFSQLAKSIYLPLTALYYMERWSIVTSDATPPLPSNLS
jgi:hypothetical protein